MCSLVERIYNDYLMRCLFKKLDEAIILKDRAKYNEAMKLCKQRYEELKVEHSEKMARYYAAGGGR